jgi:Fur family transcriptional regulator, zinc uptake regulator
MHYSSEFSIYCKGFSLTLTSLRKAVLHVLWQTKKPLKAYDILESLKDEQPNATAATIYRALSFFTMAGVVHKLDSIQSYALCGEPETSVCSEVLMVCSSCHDVCEVQGQMVRDAAVNLARLDAFVLNHTPIELRGLCGSCSKDAIA